MLEEEEFTPDLKTETGSKSSWEESLPLPLPEETGVDLTQTEPVNNGEIPQKTEITPVATVVKKENLLFLRFFNKKIAGLFLVLATLFVAGFFIFNFSKPFFSARKISKSPKVALKRISSAFIPKTPNSEPANLSLNWVQIDNTLGFSFSHPEEFLVVKAANLQGYTIYYPVIDENEENFSKTVFVKILITKLSAPNNVKLEEFLLSRYNLSKAEVKQIEMSSKTSLAFAFDQTFIATKVFDKQLFLLEGKVSENLDFANFIPIFTAMLESIQVV